MRHVSQGLLMFAACLPLCGTPLSLTAAPPEPKKTLFYDAVVTAERLAEPFSLDARLEAVKLSEVLRLLEDRVGVTILLDVKSLNPNGDADLAAVLKELENRELTFPAMKKVKVETVLKYVCDQINAVHVIEGDHIRIVSAAVKDHLNGEANLVQNLAQGGKPENEVLTKEDRIRLTPTVTLAFDQKPLTEVIQSLAERTGRNFILSSSAKLQTNTLVTVSLANVPYETAAVAVAESAGLRIVKQGNVLMFVSPERFKEFNSPASNPVQFQVASGLGTITFEELETIGRLINGMKPADGDLKKELEKLKQERSAAESSRKELMDKIEQLKEELGKRKP